MVTGPCAEWLFGKIIQLQILLFVVDVCCNFANFVCRNGPLGVVVYADMHNNNNTGTLVMKEKFESIKEFGAKYIVSNFGRIINKETGAEIKPGTNNCGYKYVILCHNGIRKKFYVHRLVATYFLKNGKGFTEVNHIDENKANNMSINLCWCSHLENSNYATRGLRIGQSLRNGKSSKNVLQFDKFGTLLKRWPSVREIERSLGFNHSNIAACCRGKIETAYNYIWEYANC